MSSSCEMQAVTWARAVSQRVRIFKRCGSCGADFAELGRVVGGLWPMGEAMASVLRMDPASWNRFTD